MPALDSCLKAHWCMLACCPASACIVLLNGLTVLLITISDGGSKCQTLRCMLHAKCQHVKISSPADPSCCRTWADGAAHQRPGDGGRQMLMPKSTSMFDMQIFDSFQAHRADERPDDAAHQRLRWPPQYPTRHTTSNTLDINFYTIHAGASCCPMA